MKENTYDNEDFFNKYRQMPRSVGGLQAAGEWHALKKMLPDFSDKRVLDLGCGFGWHCRYAVEHGAASVVGIDISERMLSEARQKNAFPNVQYLCRSIETMDEMPERFDVVISSLAFHYIAPFREICTKVYRCLAPHGVFVFSAEHPIFTAHGVQEWHYDKQGKALHWPVDRYFTEGWRHAIFLGEPVTKYHRTLTTYVNDLMSTGFTLTGLVEPEPDPTMLDYPGMREELRRPMMLLISAQK